MCSRSAAAELEQADDWENLLHENQVRERILKIQGKDYYVQYKHLSEEAAETGALVFIRNTDRIMEEERKIRKGLAEKGLTAKYSFQIFLEKARQFVRISIWHSVTAGLIPMF